MSNRAIQALDPLRFTQRDKQLLDLALMGQGNNGNGNGGPSSPHDPDAIHEGDTAGGDLAGTYPNPTLRQPIQWSPLIVATPNATLCTIAIDDTDYATTGNLTMIPQAAAGYSQSVIVATPGGRVVRLTIDDTDYATTGNLTLIPVVV